VRAAILRVLTPANRGSVAALAYQCASTFRATDFAGGCNGARIRFAPQKDWAGNKGLVEPTVSLLQPVKAAFPDLSWADLIVLAGTIAAEQAAGGAGSTAAPWSFCPGRSDAPDAAGTDYLAPRTYPKVETAVVDNARVMGLSAGEAVALAARPRPAAYAKALGLSGTYLPAGAPATLSNAYFRLLLGLPWQPVNGSSQVRASGRGAAAILAAQGPDGVAAEAGAAGAGGDVFMSAADMAIKDDATLAAVAREYAADNAKFLRAHAAAWTKLMNADRFDGPAANACATPA
jgi:catalase (peroxidase I)